MEWNNPFVAPFTQVRYEECSASRVLTYILFYYPMNVPSSLAVRKWRASCSSFKVLVFQPRYGADPAPAMDGVMRQNNTQTWNPFA